MCNWPHIVCLLVLAAGTPSRGSAAGEETPEASMPNIVVIYADDLGYGDVACYNRERGKIPTPHIDRLAAQGMRFTDAHSSSGVCSPSRYTLLTGRYHWRTRLQQGIVEPWGPPLIAPNRMTIASMLKQRGYRTACIGKWHLGWDWPIEAGKRRLFRSKIEADGPTDEHVAAWQHTFSQPIAGGPITRGFDEYFGADVPNWPPFCFIDQDRTVGIPAEWLPQRLFENHQASRQGPALKNWQLELILPKIGDRACDFIRRMSSEQRRFFLYVPLTAPHTPLAVNDEWQRKSGLNTYGDFVMETDAMIGRIVAALDQAGSADETLVMFTSDNGFAPYVGGRVLEAKGHFPSGPLRGYKSDAWEGGHRVPMIVRWPGRVKPGAVNRQLVHQADYMATCAAVVGAELPADAGEDSFNLLPLLQGNDAPVREHAVSQSSGGLLCIRRGDWKLIFGPGSGGWSKGQGLAPMQLYNLRDDLGETSNLFDKYPETVKQLTTLMKEFIRRGRSTAGPAQENDVPVKWKRFMKTAAK